MNSTQITFFMPVTDPDVIIADYCIKSYSRIKNIKFKLLIFSNYISSNNKRIYFPRWSNYHYVKIVENHSLGKNIKLNILDLENPEITEKYQSGTKKLGYKSWKWEAPFERYDFILDRELKRINTPYVATVDADFEILNDQFITYMIDEMEKNPNLKVISADYSPTVKYPFAKYPNGYYILHGRYNTWFCIYKKEALNLSVSNRYRDTLDDKTKEFEIWDTSSYFQEKLRQKYGYEMESCPVYFQSCFIHYTAFSKNRSINKKNIRFYRFIRLLAKNGLLSTLFNNFSYDRSQNTLFHRFDYKIGYILSGRLFDTFFKNIDDERKKAIFVKEREKLL